ncbi:MAG: carbon-nitrogen hydrolase family protein [Acidimicrobiales bacterium]
MRLAVGQLRCDALDDDGRLIALDDVVRRAAAAGAELVVLPEMAACGYLLDPDHLDRHAEPDDGSGPVLTRWRELARSLGVAIIGGFAERTDSGIANAAVVIDASGTVLGTYRKLHLFGAEHRLFVPGDRGLPVFTLGDTRVGVLICYDLRFPESARILALQGADVVAVPTAWVGGFDRSAPISGSIGQVDGVLVQANLDQIYIACADQVGTESPIEFLGRSVVADPYGQPLVGPLSPDAEDLAVVEVDPAVARAAQERGRGISPRHNRRTDVYGELLGYREPAPRRSPS